MLKLQDNILADNGDDDDEEEEDKLQGGSHLQNPLSARIFYCNDY